MKKLTKILCLVLSLALLVSMFAACGEKKPVEKPDDKPEVKGDPVMPTFADDEEIYDKVLGEYYEVYAKAKEAKTVAERFALMAIAEAKLLESGIMVPMQSNGGNYAVSKVAPNTITSVLWGNDEYRYHDALVCTKPVTLEDRNALKALFSEKKGTGTYLAAAKEYLASKGYELQRTYSLGYNSDPETYDTFRTSMAVDSEVLVNTYDGLLEYNVENTLTPMLATALPTVSEDGLKYTFTLRQGVKWCDSTKKVIGEVKADDFVAGFQHMLDDPEGGLSWLVDGVVAGVTEYINGDTEDFGTVGVKALDDYTVEYTLTAPCSYFDTMFGYGLFAPLSRKYYEGLGGKFGFDSETGKYGTNKDTIAYCGPYIVSSAIAENTFVFEKNPNYWNAANINLDKITWIYNSGKIDTQAWSDFDAGTIDGCGLNAACLELAKAKKVEGSDKSFFDVYGYVSATDASSFPGFFNVYRRGFADFTDETQQKSAKDESMKIRTANAMLNKNFRLALVQAFDRGAYMEQSVGADLKYTSMCNSYTPGTFVSLPNEVTVSINGTDKTYPAGTFYGQIMQDQVAADGYTFKVFDPTQDGGIGSSSGFDGWYDAAAAKASLDKAIEELKAANVEITKENPIHIDYPYQEDGGVRTARANVVKTSIEASLEGKVVVDLVPTQDQKVYLNSTYYFKQGSQANYDLSINSGWGPDYGDPSSYLDTMIKGGGYMIKSIGIDA